MSAPASVERSETAPEDWSGLPTKASVKAASRRAAQAQQAAARARYRELHAELNPNAPDKVVDALIYLHAQGSGAATAVHSGETRDTCEERTQC